MLPKALTLTPQYQEYVWGGHKLRPGSLTAEAWIVYEDDLVFQGPLAGKSLRELAALFGEDLLGTKGTQQSGGRFPILIKLLDCNSWLSLQVHPNDKQAVELEGAGHKGKTEAWYILDADIEARLIAGLSPGTTRHNLTDAIQNGSILDIANYVSANTGDLIYMPAGTIHALGPGLLVYEVQQSSNITYRVFDWNRPQTKERGLHIEKSLAVANTSEVVHAIPAPRLNDGECKVICESEYFTLELLNSHRTPINLNTKGLSFHALTVIEGAARFSSSGEVYNMKRFVTLLVPAATGVYTLEPQGSGFRILKSMV
jgi:mannose-6-phosphate isomerase